MSCAKFVLPLRRRGLPLYPPRIVGIINVTPDSFSDGGEAYLPEAALQRAAKLIEEGADILDIGAVSTRPGAPEVPLEEELRRLLPALRLIRKQFPEVPISIDTYRGEVARIAIEEGADLINDISGGAFDPELWKVVAHYRVPYILMHIKGTPQTMQHNPVYENLIQEVWEYFVQKLNALRALGVEDVIIDPGFGFGKTVEHNYALFRALPLFKRLGRPILIGISRKSMLWRPLKATPHTVLPAMSALHWEALRKGVCLLRVHDVAAARQLISLLDLWNSLELG
ncbi:MAG: dihydropteroate synthase [Bacteroidia bacterium]|nr:dihydropteroate synthase [Bacteroidia bacterium]MCX7764216.1 dihydropteroate synthase [Bacteroidia bacterium]MDW8056892.1 dihydropteroate synthase [Bacteroidia bacterium]